MAAADAEIVDIAKEKQRFQSGEDAFDAQWGGGWVVIHDWGMISGEKYVFWC